MELQLPLLESRLYLSPEPRTASKRLSSLYSQSKRAVSLTGWSLEQPRTAHWLQVKGRLLCAISLKGLFLSPAAGSAICSCSCWYPLQWPQLLNRWTWVTALLQSSSQRDWSYPHRTPTAGGGREGVMLNHTVFPQRLWPMNFNIHIFNQWTLANW